MAWLRKHERAYLAFLLIAALGLLFGGLDSFGIWDPWELSVADEARRLVNGEQSSAPFVPAATQLIAQAFGVFGTYGWSGRLPLAIAGLFTLGLSVWLTMRLAGRRASFWSGLVLVTTPSLLFASRQMVGQTPSFAASALVFTSAMLLVFAPLRVPPQDAQSGLGSRRELRAQLGWLLLFLGAIVISALTSGVLRGVLPPLLGVGAAVIARGSLREWQRDRAKSSAAALVLATGIVLGAITTWAVAADFADYNIWTGGLPRGGNPPSWEVAIEHIFHSFAPWSAILPIALSAMLLPRTTAHAPQSESALRTAPSELRIAYPEENALRIAVVAWAAFGFAAQTTFTSRYGPSAFTAIVPLGIAVGLMVRDFERRSEGHWGIALVTGLFALLIVRDYRAYSVGPIEGLALSNLSMPDTEIFSPHRQWAGVILLFALLLSVAIAVNPEVQKESGKDAKRAWREGFGAFAIFVLDRFLPLRPLLRTQWQRGLGYKAWLIAGLLLVLSCLTVGVASLAAPAQVAGLFGSSLAIKICRVLLVVPFALPLAALVGRIGFWAIGSLGQHRFVPSALAATGVGAFAVFGFVPELSSHFSPRDVYETFQQLSGPEDRLAEFRVGGRAASYYVEREVEELQNQGQLLSFLNQDTRTWATLRPTDLPRIDRAYRAAHQRHLFIADNRNANILLATNQVLEGRDNLNPLAQAVLRERPAPSHALNIDFDGKIALIGYDLNLPHQDSVAPGETFEIVWYFQSLATVAGNYRPFVHIDGPGQRINGDHQPVDGDYPVNLWSVGDYIVDRQNIQVPANYVRGDLTIYIGFYSGNNRLSVTTGPHDNANRARVGRLPIR